MVGKITGKEEEASNLVTQMESRITAVIDETKNLEKRPGVFYITWHEPLWSVGSGTTTQELIEKAGNKPFEWAKTEPRLSVTEACKNNRIYQVDADLVSRAGPRVVDALEWFAYFIHPDVFGNPREAIK